MIPVRKVIHNGRARLVYDLPSEEPKAPISPRKPRPMVVLPEAVLVRRCAMQLLYDEGKSLTAIGREYNITRQRVAQILELNKKD